MDYVHLVKVLHGCDHLTSVARRDRLVKTPHTSEECIKLTSWSILKNYVDFLLIKEKAVHLQYILVFEMTVNLNLSS